MQSSKTSSTKNRCEGMSSKPAINTVQPGVMVRSVILSPPQQKLRQQQAKGETEWDWKWEGLQEAWQSSKHDKCPSKYLWDCQ